MTPLTKPVHRVTEARYINAPIILTVAPIQGQQAESLLAFRLKGTRTAYVVAVSSAYRWAAQAYAGKEAAARRAARKQGIPWKQAKRQFIKDNSLPVYIPKKVVKSSQPDIQEIAYDEQQ